MGRFLLLSGLLPMVLALAGFKWFFERPFKRLHGGRVSLSAAEFELALSKASGGKALPLNEGIGNSAAISKDLAVVAQAGLSFGRSLLAQRQPELLKWRASALRFGWAFPAFAWLVLIFFALGAGGARWLLPGGVLALAAGTAVNWMAVYVDLQAAALTEQALKKRAVVARQSEEDNLRRMMRALAFQNLLPAFLARLFGAPRGRK